ncbi:unnamed protein product [Lymnaea stagnalis]|uniref:UBC core domain-containing protein n=1 Tax=Lymnaea stagnalis TaxID=6523 RepID=A0AAV2HUT9_LYMST
MANEARKNAIKRLMFDQEELTQSPVGNVSASPLDDDMFEWHCNIKQDDIIYHLILFFPQNYPYSSPSAEFVPTGFNYRGGAVQSGKKGTKICLNIFSDFANVHTEWQDEKGLGWSPGYTIQSVLMNVVSFLSEIQSSPQTSSSDANKHNLTLSKAFVCTDCGHKYETPFPPLDNADDSLPVEAKGKRSKNKPQRGKTAVEKAKVAIKQKSGATPKPIIDYISKQDFTVQKPAGTDDLFGFGLAVSGNKWRPTLTSPCEFLTMGSFNGMNKSVGVVHSVLKEKLEIFLPLFIHPIHGAHIKDEFENALKKVAKIMPKYDPKTSSTEDLVLKTIPNLMSATVVEFSKGTQHTSDNSLNGYFALHRLLLWAIDTYPNLQAQIEQQVGDYVEHESNRIKHKVPYIAEWLMLVPGSRNYRWRDVAEAYLSESWKRGPLFYVKDDEKLGYLDTPKDYRLQKTYEHTEVSRKHLAFQASFLDIAMPAGMSREDVIKRYDDNFGFPTEDMVAEMKRAFARINDEMHSYADWFEILKLPAPTEDELYSTMMEAVRYSIVTDGYHWTFSQTAGGWKPVLKKYEKMREEHKKTGRSHAENEKKKATSQATAKKQSTGRRGRGKTAADDGGDEADEGTDTNVTDVKKQPKGDKAKGRKRKADQGLHDVTTSAKKGRGTKKK